MQLEEFFDYKNQLMEDLLTTESIVKLIDESIDMKDAAKLAYKNVFPYEYLPDTVEHGETFICFDVDVSKAPTKTYFLPTIYVWIFAHKSKLRLPAYEEPPVLPGGSFFESQQTMKSCLIYTHSTG